jgi:predicted transcriptional regulator
MREHYVPNPKVKRDRTEIFAQILKLCAKPTVKTRIMYKTNLSYNVLLEILKQLQTLELLTLDKAIKKYVTTGKGQEYLAKWSAVQELLKI